MPHLPQTAITDSNLNCRTLVRDRRQEDKGNRLRQLSSGLLAI